MTTMQMQRCAWLYWRVSEHELVAALSGSDLERRRARERARRAQRLADMYSDWLIEELAR